MVSFSLIKNQDIAKDIAQDFFVSYWQKRNAISIKTSFKPYATKAVRNLSLLYLEKVEKEKKLLRNLEPRKFVEQEYKEKFIKKGKGLLELLNQLPEARRRIFVSSVVHGLSYAEIAENNDISINTVKTQMKRAYTFLRDRAVRNQVLLFLVAYVFVK